MWTTGHSTNHNTLTEKDPFHSVRILYYTYPEVVLNPNLYQSDIFHGHFEMFKCPPQLPNSRVCQASQLLSKTVYPLSGDPVHMQLLECQCFAPSQPL